MPRRSTLIYPVPPAPRTAVLGGWFRAAGPVRVFPGGWNREAAEFAQSIAARREQLEELIGIADPTHALILVRYEWEDAIPWRARRRLWNAFGVPLFEQIVDVNGDLLAAECEAHKGLHVVSRRFAVGDHEVDRMPCGCGRTSPRLIAVEVRSLAAAGR